MSTTLYVAAALAFLVGVAHSYLGERYVLTRLFRRSDLPHLFGSDVFTRRTLRGAWHLTTIAWWGCAALFLVFACANCEPVSDSLRILSLVFLFSAIATGVGSRGRHLAWPVFLIIAIAAWMSAGF